MEILSGLWRKKAQQHKLKPKRDMRKVLEDIKDIFLDIVSIEVNNESPIIEKLVHIIYKLNEDSDGQNKILQRGER
jgi:hypothetical protein